MHLYAFHDFKGCEVSSSCVLPVSLTGWKWPNRARSNGGYWTWFILITKKNSVSFHLWLLLCMSITSLNLSGHSNDLICFQYEPVYDRFTALAAPALLLPPPLKFLELLLVIKIQATRSGLVIYQPRHKRRGRRQTYITRYSSQILHYTVYLAKYCDALYFISHVFHPRTLPSVSVYPSSQKYSRLSMSINIGSRHHIEMVFRYTLVLDGGRLAYE